MSLTLTASINLPQLLVFPLAAITIAVILILFYKLKRVRSSLATTQDRLRKLEDETGNFITKLDRANSQRDKLLDALDDAFLLVEDEVTVRVANAKARELFGDRSVIDRPLNEVVLNPRLLSLLQDCLRENSRVSRRTVLRQRNSTDAESSGLGEVAYEVDTAPFSRTLHLKRVTIRDITQAHLTEQVRKDFVANASHELRTPLAIINGYLENLLDDDILEDPKMSRRFLKTMRKHSSRISRIIEDMLVISKLESGEAAALRIKPFKFRKCLNDVLERLNQIIADNQTIIDIQMPDEELKVDGDRFYLTQIFFNLIENAIKQNPGTQLTVTISAKSENDTTYLSVADNGVGIPASHLPFIFKRFYRVETHHSQEIRGTGLGLSIVKRGVEAHGGSISVTSKPGQETVFSIILPHQNLRDKASEIKQNERTNLLLK